MHVIHVYDDCFVNATSALMLSKQAIRYTEISVQNVGSIQSKRPQPFQYVVVKCESKTVYWKTICVFFIRDY